MKNLPDRAKGIENIRLRQVFFKEIYYELVLETWFNIITQFNLDHSVAEVWTNIGARGERICKGNWTFDK